VLRWAALIPCVPHDFCHHGARVLVPLIIVCGVVAVMVAAIGRWRR